MEQQFLVNGTLMEVEDGGLGDGSPHHYQVRVNRRITLVYNAPPNRHREVLEDALTRLGESEEIDLGLAEFPADRIVRV